jgi:peptide/nickel transport system permease protein
MGLFLDPAGAAALPPYEAGGDTAELVTSEGSRGGVAAFLRDPKGVIGLGIVLAACLFCFVGPLLYHTDQTHPNLLQLNQPPSSDHLLGTDDLGYDVLGRLMVGGQTALVIGMAAAVLATGFGVVWGAVSGFVGGPVDTLMMRVVDTFMSIPPLFLLLVLAAIVTPSVGILILVVALVAWLYPARLIRGETLLLRERDYVAVVRVLGGSNTRILTRHIIPNTIGTIMVNVTFQVADAILLIASLSFLGLGVPPPATNWGAMLTNGVQYIYSGYWWEIYPAGLAIVLTVVGFNLIGDALRDAFETRLRPR